MYLTADNLVHYLMARGLIDPADVVRGDFLAIESSRRNRNFRVLRRDAVSLFVKQVPMMVPATVDSVRREADCCRLPDQLQALAPLRNFMPRLIGFDAVAHIVVSELIVDGQNLNEYHNGVRAFVSPLGSMQGRALGLVHATTAPALRSIGELVALPCRPPWFFQALHHTEVVLPDISPRMRRAVFALQQMPDVMAAFVAIQTEWTPSSLTHNDIKWDNIVVAPRGGGLALRFVDWELGDVGDPAWDVGCILAAYVQYWLFYVHPAEATTAASGDGKFGDLQREASAFWQEYVRSAGLAAADAQHLLTRSVRLAGIRLLQTFVETQGVVDSSLPSSPLLLNVARHVLANAALCQLEVFGIEQAVADAAPRVAPTLRAGEVAAVAPADIQMRSTPVAKPAISPDLERTLLRICDDVRIQSPTSFSLRDQAPVMVPQTTAAMTAGLPKSGMSGQGYAAGTDTAYHTIAGRLVEALWPILYWNFYVRERDDLPVCMPTAAEPDLEFVERLSAANQTRSHDDPAWQVYQREPDGSVHVRKGDRFRRILSGGYVGEQGREVAVGDRVSVHIVGESCDIMADFYFAFGDALGSEFDEGHLLRVYFNLTADGACRMVEWLTGTLNRYAIPFRFKCLNRRSAYEAGRADAGVLYIPRRFHQAVIGLIVSKQETLGAWLNPGTCLFARPLAPGICAAEEPGTGESFGQSRMRLVSRGIVDAWYLGAIDSRARLAIVGDTFAKAGLSLERPHLNAGSAEFCAWPA